MAILVLRIRGNINTPYWAERTMQLLHLKKRYNATIVKEDPSILGMLYKIKHYVAWQKIDTDTIKEIIEKRGKRIGNSEELRLDEIAMKIANNDIKLSSIKSIRPWFALNPPRGGFKRSTKRMYTQKGVTGENAELIKLVRRML